MNAGPRTHSYAWRGAREPMLRFGPEDGPVVVLALPLFEEANRTRALGTGILRALAAQGVGGILPDLPAQGESEMPTSHLSLADLRHAFASVPGTHTIAIRSGALLVDEARPSWQLSPQTGPDLLRELTRLSPGALAERQNLIAGNIVPGAFLATLAIHPGEGGDPVPYGPQAQSRPQNRRRVRLTSDPQPADLHIEGPALWRRAEPGNDWTLQQQLAADIAAWVRTCAA